MKTQLLKTAVLLVCFICSNQLFSEGRPVGPARTVAPSAVQVNPANPAGTPVVRGQVAAPAVQGQPMQGQYYQQRPGTVVAQAPAQPVNPVLDQKQRLLKKLTDKLIVYKEKPVSIVVSRPIDHTSKKVGPLVYDALLAALKQYGDLNVRSSDNLIEFLTLDEFRKAMGKAGADVLFVTVLKNNNFDLYVYDKRTPFSIYAHSEAISHVGQLDLSTEMATYYAQLVLRRTLYRYINDQYFELPRRESAPVMRSEVPKWIASPESVKNVNRELRSHLYASAMTGAAFTFGRSTQGWNASLLGLSLGVHLGARNYLELSAATSTYNAFVASFKHVFTSRETPFQVGVGLGYGYVTSKKVWSYDETYGLGTDSYYIVPNVMLLFPIGGIHLRFEHKSYVGLDFKKYMFTFMPGIQVYF
jgi:hypothetical protein